MSELKQKLERARIVAFALMKPSVRGLIETCTDVRTREEACAWRYRIVDKIIDKAKARPSGYFSELRANCPLCGYGGSSWYQADGYKMPDGLRMHLLGSGRASECDIMMLAFEAAIDAADSRSTQ